MNPMPLAVVDASGTVSFVTGPGRGHATGDGGPAGRTSPYPLPRACAVAP